MGCLKINKIYWTNTIILQLVLLLKMKQLCKIPMSVLLKDLLNKMIKNLEEKQQNTTKEMFYLLMMNLFKLWIKQKASLKESLK